MIYLLLDVENGNVRRNGHFSFAEGAEKRGFTNTVLTNQTVAAAIGQGQVSISENPLASNRDVDAVDLDVLALCA